MHQKHKAPDSKVHSKRLGRELAMQYLFELELREETDTPENWAAFKTSAFETLGIHENRQSRKAFEYAEQLLGGIAANRSSVDEAILARLAHWDWSRLAVIDRNVMRVAVYEMLFVPSVPPVVSINEAVEIVRDYSGFRSGNFVNGVLNSIKETLARPPREAVESL